MLKGELSRHAVWFGSRFVYLLGHCGEDQSHTAMAFLTRECSQQCCVFTAVLCVHRSVVCSPQCCVFTAELCVCRLCFCPNK